MITFRKICILIDFGNPFSLFYIFYIGTCNDIISKPEENQDYKEAEQIFKLNSHSVGISNDTQWPGGMVSYREPATPQAGCQGYRG